MVGAIAVAVGLACHAVALAAKAGPALAIAGPEFVGENSATHQGATSRADVEPATPTADLRSALLAADDARIHGPAHRAVIAAALASGAARTQAMAVRAIGRTRRAEFLGAAVAALGNASIDVRREAAFAVAHIGSVDRAAHEPALAALRQRLTREPDPFVAASLAESVGRLAFPSVASVEVTASELADAWVRWDAGPARAVVSVGVGRAAEAMARRVRTLAGAGSDSPRLVLLLESLIEQHASPARGTIALQDALNRRVRRLATSGLLTLRRLSAARAVAAASDVDAQVRRLAVLGLAVRPDVSDADAAAAFADESMLVRHAAVARLGSRFPLRAEAALSDRHVAVRLAALDALGEAGACRAACESRLIAPPTDAAWHEHAHALVAVARTDAAAARPFVVRGSTATIWQVRMYAARAAGTTVQADVLEALSTDPDVNVRHAALTAWREAKLPKLTTAAVRALGSNDGQLVLEAARALEGAREPEVVPALRTALHRLTALRRETSRDPRLALVERLDELDLERATTLRPYTADFDPVIADRATALLSARGVGPVSGNAGSGSPELRRTRPAGRMAGTRGFPDAAQVSDGRLPAVAVPTWEEVERLGNTTVTLRMRNGRELTMRLYADIAPTAVARFVAQVYAGEWNGRTFHRVEPGFVVQGGSPAANEYAGAADFTRDEFSPLSHARGTVGISTRGPDTGDGQIFINLVDNPRLDFSYSVIGSIVGEAALLDDIVEGDAIGTAATHEARRAQ